MSEVFTYIIGPLVAAMLTWFFARKMQAQEVLKLKQEVEQLRQTAKSTELENVEKAITIWREMAENLKAELEKVRKDMADINSQNEELLKRLDSIEKDYSALNKSYNTLKKQLNK